MKKVLVIGCVVFALGVAVVLVATCIRPPDGHYDFNLRMNELACVRQGVNPYDVWHGDVSMPPYYSNTHKGPAPAGCTKQVNAYAPWAYIYMLPLSSLSMGVSWFVYCLLMGVALVGVVAMTRSGRCEGWSNDVLLIVAPLVVVSYTLFANVSVGNFAIFVLLGSVLMAWGLDRGHDVLVGIGWALAAVKPQLAMLFAIPLLLRKKFIPFVVSGLICMGATVVMSVVLKTSVLDLLLQGPAANTEFFQGCGTWPRFLCGAFGAEKDILIGLTIGAVICAILTLLVRKARDWFVVLMPAAICAASWTYASNYCQVMGWFLMFVLVQELIACPRSKFLWLLTVLAVFSLARWPMAMNGLCGFMGWRSPFGEYALRCVDSLNSTLSLSLAAAFCVWYSTHSSLNKNS